MQKPACALSVPIHPKEFMMNSVPFAEFRIEPTIDEIHHLIGYKAGIITIDDGGFAKSFMKNFKEYRPGEETLYDK